MMNNYKYDSLYGNYRQLSFTQTWETAEEFLSEIKETPFTGGLSDEDLTQVFYLLYARYGNDIWASSDINRAKWQCFSTIFQYAPNWKKKLEIQGRLRDLNDNEVIAGDTVINNHAFHDATAPSSQTVEELQYINEQSVNKNRKNKVKAYTELYLMLEDNITDVFLAKFKKLFLSVVTPEQALYYVTEDEEEEDE